MIVNELVCIEKGRYDEGSKERDRGGEKERRGEPKFYRDSRFNLERHNSLFFIAFIYAIESTRSDPSLVHSHFDFLPVAA